MALPPSEHQRLDPLQIGHADRLQDDLTYVVWQANGPVFAGTCYREGIGQEEQGWHNMARCVCFSLCNDMTAR